MSLLDIDERILELADLVDLDVSPFDDKKAFDRPVDVGFVEGGCSNEYNVRELRNFASIAASWSRLAPARSMAACRRCATRSVCVNAWRPSIFNGVSLEGGGTIPNDEDLPLLLDRVYPRTRW